MRCEKLRAEPVVSDSGHLGEVEDLHGECVRGRPSVTIGEQMGGQELRADRIDEDWTLGAC